MPSYFDQVEKHPDQGMTDGDIEATRRVAERRDEIIIFRSTGPWPRPLIDMGHPTKPFTVKGKSSTWGPMAGFVPFVAEFSKAAAPKDIADGDAANAKTLKNGDAKKVPLVVTKEYIDRWFTVPRGMTNRPAVDKINEPRKGILHMWARKPGKDDKISSSSQRYGFIARQLNGTDWEILTFLNPIAKKQAAFVQDLTELESKAEPLLVIAEPRSGVPITGDYDLFAICPSFDSFGGSDFKLQRDLARPARMGPHHADSQLNTLDDAHRAGGEEDPFRGNITRRIFEVILELNDAMGAPYGEGMEIRKPNVYQGAVYNQRVHHNAESGRPFAPGAEECFPLTTFHPGRIGPYTFRTAVLNDTADLRTYFETIYMAGYYPPRNPSWKMTNVNPQFARVAAMAAANPNMFRGR